MRLGVLASVAGVATMMTVGCAKGLPTARRVPFGGSGGLVAGPRPQHGGSGGLVAGPRPQHGGSGGLVAGPRIERGLGGDGFVSGPRVRLDPRPERVEYVGPDRVTLLDGTPLLGELASLDPYMVRFADGLRVPRVIVGGVEFGEAGDLPALGAHPLHDIVALRDGEWLEGAVISINGARVRVAVYGPDMMTRGIQVVRREDIAAMALRDRRDSPCARAALVLADGGESGRLVAEVSNLDIDEVQVFWLADAGVPRQDKLLRCFERGSASSCQVASWLGPGTQCPSMVGGLEVHALRDDVGHMSENRKFYYALRGGERTLAASTVVQRGERHLHGIHPARLNTDYRGEAHYWDTSWRNRQDDGIHAVDK